MPLYILYVESPRPKTENLILDKESLGNEFINKKSQNLFIAVGGSPYPNKYISIKLRNYL